MNKLKKKSITRTFQNLGNCNLRDTKIIANVLFSLFSVAQVTKQALIGRFHEFIGKPYQCS